jgi:cation transporter-like permease
MVSVPPSFLDFLGGNVGLEYAGCSLNLHLGMFTMKKQIVQVSMLQSAKVVAGLYFVISLPVVLVLAALMSLSAQGVNMWVLVLFPLLQAVVSFLFALLGGWTYNLVAARLGGFEFMTAEVGKTAPH